jgi:nitronate monooxygenase
MDLGLASRDRPTYPGQRGLTQTMRDAATKSNDLDRMQAWAGQSSAMAIPRAADEVACDFWEGARVLLSRTRL